MSLRVVFAGGGTGGHLYPSLAIAEDLRRLAPEPRVVFACSNRPIDERILRAEGQEFRVIPASPAVASARGAIRFLRSWGASVRAGRRLLRAHPGAIVVAMGGFVAAPVVRAARVERSPVLMVNLDAVPGRANRLIARGATRIVSAAPEREFGWERIPPIVRARARASLPAAACRRELGLDPDRPTLLVTGGSQGARSINALLGRLVARRPDSFQGWQVLHQAGGRAKDGADEGASVRAAYSDAGVPAQVVDLIARMDLAWGAADLAVARAGAGTVGEVWANRVPTVFMPYPFHADAHQAANARPLIEARSGGVAGAIVEADRIDPGANEAGAGASILRLMGDAAARAGMRASLAALGPADGSERVARLILEMARQVEGVIE